ncbi:Rieske 2Fe-2S domain-containing protein [Pigmentiphaga sp.]|jgi:Phenylpropionate dioxygenase and related ring-hydroxylating dioxygenases, large terminal subunit|uniref:Rieske 2Fe-2S domain-containing protein n=1 Tax=Pigmentiphaga sp. TaxID=1977564 RepID=UPI0025F6DA06|nr:Rieske 2Fe-2S domain-containing protein [Pigmentiphaga sp.]
MTTVTPMALDERAERFLALTKTGPDTDMGKLLRRFWHPVALASDVGPGEAKTITILSEELTLYRSQSGTPHLIGGRCAHRRTLLSTGWVDGDTVRCIYHGWRFDSSGACVERPAEVDTGMPRTRIAGYPVYEYGGLIFAYMGEAPVPEFDLPRKALTELEGAVLRNGVERWDNNWFQQIENSMDATHVSFVHHALKVGPFGAAVTNAVPKLEYQETPAGIRQIGRRADNNVRVSDWTFPNNNHITVPGLKPEDPWIDVFVWMVPNDDLNTTRFMIYSLPPGGSEESRQRFEQYFDTYGKYDPAAHHDELFAMREWNNPDDMFVGLTAAQDYLAIRGQGRIVDRTKEVLGRSDLGIVTLRKLFWRELDKLRNGEPTKEWRRLTEAERLPTQPGLAQSAA